MSAVTPALDPLIAEAKFRMRRRRVLLAVVALFAAAAVAALTLRPSGAPGTTRVTGHHPGQDAQLAHLKVPVDATERQWRAGIRAIVPECACGLTAKGATELRDKVVAAAHKTDATVVRIRVWKPSGEVEAVLATRTNPAEYLVHRASLLVNLLSHGYPYVRIVNGSGSRFYEWYRLPGQGGVWMPRPLTLCGPIGVSPPLSTPSCPVK